VLSVALATLTACGSGDAGGGVPVRRLQDAALLAASDPTRCPLDLGLADAMAGVRPVRGGGAATGTPVGRVPGGSSLLAVGGASYRCAYQVDGRPLTLVVVAVPEGRQTADAVGALTTPLEEVGLDRAATRSLVDAAKAARARSGVAAPSGSASAASTELGGGGAASVAIVAAEGGPTGVQLATAAEALAEELAG